MHYPCNQTPFQCKYTNIEQETCSIYNHTPSSPLKSCRSSRPSHLHFVARGPLQQRHGQALLLGSVIVLHSWTRTIRLSFLPALKKLHVLCDYIPRLLNKSFLRHECCVRDPPILSSITWPYRNMQSVSWRVWLLDRCPSFQGIECRDVRDKCNSESFDRRPSGSVDL